MSYFITIYIEQYKSKGGLQTDNALVLNLKSKAISSGD
jgi:hypothetical protein